MNTVHAVPISYETPAGSTVGDGPVNAKAVFTPGRDSLELVLENLQTGIVSIGENVSDLTFTLNNTSLTSASFAATGNSTLERTVAGGGGTFTDGSTLTTGSGIGWVLANVGGGSFHLDVLNGTGHAGPYPAWSTERRHSIYDCQWIDSRQSCAQPVPGWSHHPEFDDRRGDE
jgi:hypothetical protein